MRIYQAYYLLETIYHLDYQLPYQEHSLHMASYLYGWFGVLANNPKISLEEI